MSNSVWPHRRQHTRLPCPWDSPGKNTGVGCYCLLQCMKLKSESEVTQPCPTLTDPMDCKPTRAPHPWDSPDNSSGVGCYCLLRNSKLEGHNHPCRTHQFSSVRLCDPMNRSMPGLPVHHQLPKFTQTHVRQVSDAIQPSHPLSSPSPAPNPSQHQGLFQWVNSAWGGQSGGVSTSASVLPMNTQDRSL